MKQKLRIASAVLVAVLTLGMGAVASEQSATGYMEDIAQEDNNSGDSASGNNVSKQDTKMVIDQQQWQRSNAGSSIEVTTYQLEKKVFPGVYEDDGAFSQYDSIIINNKTYNFWKDINNSVDDIVVVSNISEVSESDDLTAYVRTIFAFPAFSEENNELHLNFHRPEGATIQKIDGLAEINGQDYKLYVYNYSKPLAPGETSEPSLLEYVFDKNVTTEMIDEFGGNYKVLITSQAVQKTGFSTIADAFGATFRNVTVDNHPWKTSN